jgi:beta-glucosidase
LTDDALRFPPGFLWGAATSAHQTEGCNLNSDWWAAEQAGLVPHQSGDACDSLRRWPEDLDLLRQMGLNAYRLSVEWARIEPAPGEFDLAALDHYRRVLSAVREAGLEPIVTLHHFSNPLWLAQRGGWARSSVVSRFANYVERVTRHMGDLVQWWVTLNEPTVLGLFGYVSGVWPPPRQYDFGGFLQHPRYTLAGHAAARRVLKDQSPSVFEPPRMGPHHKTEYGWEIYPKGLYRVLKRVGRLGLPVMITENGIADADDDQRARYLIAHLRQAHRALREGVDLRGYIHWSLMDNFEWAEGFSKRFGLAHVDLETKERTLRPSAHVYRRIAQANAVDVSALSAVAVGR